MKCAKRTREGERDTNICYMCVRLAVPRSARGGYTGVSRIEYLHSHSYSSQLSSAQLWTEEHTKKNRDIDCVAGRQRRGQRRQAGRHILCGVRTFDIIFINWNNNNNNVTVWRPSSLSAQNNIVCCELRLNVNSEHVRGRNTHTIRHALAHIHHSNMPTL